VQALALGKTTGCGSDHAVNPADRAGRRLEIDDLKMQEGANPSATTSDQGPRSCTLERRDDSHTRGDINALLVPCNRDSQLGGAAGPRLDG
jgi:hypothetical protein